MRVLSIAVSIALLALPTTIRAIPEVLSVIRADTVHSNFGCHFILPAGDQNQDGLADFWTWDERRLAFLYHGSADSLFGEASIKIAGVTNRSSNIGDISGDGLDDFCFTGLSGSVTDFKVYFGGPTMDSLYDLQFGENTGTPGATFQAFGEAQRGDFDADGIEELISWSADFTYALLFSLSSPLDSIHDLVFRPVGFSYPGFSFGWGMTSGDFNGDGNPDLALNLSPNEACLCKGEVWIYFGGPDFDTIPELRFSAPEPFRPLVGMQNFGTLLENLGDVNGDGIDDLFAGYNNADNLTSYIFLGGQMFDSIPDIRIADLHKTAASAGDINRDGYHDLIVGMPFQSSTATYVYVYYGGIAMDSVPDVRIYGADLPEYNLRLGSAVSGVGDVNGDGVDDFVVGAVDGFDRGEMFVFSGTGIPVDVRDDPVNPIPVFTLNQNYPNPFNGSTILGFHLTERAHVGLSIIDMTGRIVVFLLNSELSMGSHEIIWNGTNSRGEQVASGVYFYRLSVGETSIERKMLLLK